MALNDDLKAWWMLNEESGTRYDAHGSNDLAEQNTVLYDTGKVNNAANFEIDTAEYLNIADNADLSTGDIDFTWSLWVKLESKPAQSMGIVYKYTSTVDGEYFIQWQQATDRFRTMTTDGGGNYQYVVANNFGAPDLATWYHIVYWHDATANEVGIVVNDGTPNTETYTNGANDSDDEFRLGARLSDTNENFDGLMDEVGFWKRKLTSTEITWLYNSGNGRTYTLSLTPAAASAIAASTAPQVRERIVSVIASVIGATVAPQVRERVTNKVASAIGATTAPVVGIWKMLVARYHDYFLTAPQHFTISSNKVQMNARYRDYNLNAPQRERYG